VAASELPLQQYLRQYIAERLDLSPGWIEQIEIAIRLYSRFLGRQALLSDLTKLPLLGFVRSVAERTSARTANNRRCGLLVLWNSAADSGLIPPPPRRLPKCREPERMPIAWTLDELNRILAACEAERGVWDGMKVSDAWRVAITVCWDTACRRGELLAALLTDVDLGRGQWHVEAENRKGKRADKLYVLHPDTVALIRATWTERGKLFPYPFGAAQAPRHLGRIIKRAGLPVNGKRKFHCLRKTAESHAAAKMGIEWAARCVGHSPEVARKFYISPMVCRAPALIEALPRPMAVRLRVI